MRYARVSDLIRLSLQMQGTAEGVSLSDIMAEFEVSRSTAERMRSALLDALPQIEVRGEPGGEKRWRLPPRCLGGMTQPTLDEIAALHRARDLAAREGDSATADALTGLAARLQAALPAPARTRLEPDIAALLEADGVALRPGPREVIAPFLTESQQGQEFEAYLHGTGQPDLEAITRIVSATDRYRQAIKKTAEHIEESPKAKRAPARLNVSAVGLVHAARFIWELASGKRAPASAIQEGRFANYLADVFEAGGVEAEPRAAFAAWAREAKNTPQ